MKKLIITVMGLMMLGSVALAQTTVSLTDAERAKVLVHKVVDFYKANGLEATIKAVNDTKGQFVDGSLYIFIHSFDGINLARGDGNLKRLGSNVLESRDPEGKLFVEEMIKKARESGSGLTVYGFMNAATGKVEQKHSYYEKIEGALVGCGYFTER